MKRFIVGFGLALGILTLASSTALAADFVAPSDHDKNVVISNSETHKNLYVAGGSVLVNGATTGDLIAAGGNTTVEGAVEQDATVAGGTINLNGSIGGDVRAAAGTVNINSQVGGDVIVFGGTVEISDRASIGGDLVINGGTVTVAAPVKGKVKINGGDVKIDSNVAGDVTVNSGTLNFGSKAVVPGKVTYRGSQEAKIDDGAQVSSVDFQKMEHRRGGRNVAAMFTIGFVLKLLAVIVFALIVLYAFPRSSRKALNQFANRPWMNLLVGFIGLIFIPIAAIIVMVLVLGIYVGIIALLVYVLLLLLSGIIAAVYTGSWISQKLSKKDAIHYDWQGVVIGTVVFAVLKLIPIIGWLAVLVLMLIAFGGLLRGLYQYQQNDQAV